MDYKHNALRQVYRKEKFVQKRSKNEHLEAVILVWAPKVCAQKSFFVHYNLRSIHSDE